MTPVTPAQITHLVERLARRAPRPCVVALRTDAQWNGPAEIETARGPVRIRACPSGLALREALAEAQQRYTGQSTESGCTVLLTPLHNGQVALDVRARLARYTVHDLDAWRSVKEILGARELDPRIRGERWMAEALLQTLPSDGTPPLVTGTLDADTAWRWVLKGLLGLDAARPDGRDLLRWTLDSGALKSWDALAEDMREPVSRHLSGSVGPAGEAMVGTLAAGNGEHLLALGLACEVIFPPEQEREAAHHQAAARLEALTGGRSLGQREGRAWFEAAQSALPGLDEGRRQEVLFAAEQLLGDLRAPELAQASRVLPAGFDARLRNLAAHLDAQGPRPEACVTALGAVEAHDAARYESERVEAARTAVRLVAFLASPGSRALTQSALAAHARQYAEHLAFVDWLRRRLRRSEPLAELADAYRRLLQRVADLREDHSRAFGRALSEWSQGPSSGHGITPMERALDEIVAPLAAGRSVLVVVMDGMSMDVALELGEDMSRRLGWVGLLPEGEQRLPLLVSPLPTTTRFCRTSLLAGRLMDGAAADEKKAFSAHRGLRDAAGPGFKSPALLHKGDLTSPDGDLSPTVRSAIADAKQRVVGVVINVVDDHLAKADQLLLQWRVNTVRHLEALLFEAQTARRLVVFASDHGHVLENDSRTLPGGEGERWRHAANDAPPGEDEIAFQGPRETALGVGGIVLPCVERLRYAAGGSRRHGYHGGATPQEVLAPLHVWLPLGDTEPQGWRSRPQHRPEWWELERGGRVAEPRPSRRAVPPAVQPSLFESPAGPSSRAVTTWVDRLVASPSLLRQRERLGRRDPGEERLRTVLELLGERGGGPASVQQLAEALEVPLFRMNGLLAALQAVLNLEGYRVLSHDPGAGEVRLAVALAKKQFEVD